MLVCIYETTWRYNPEDQHFYLHSHKTFNLTNNILNEFDILVRLIKMSLNEIYFKVHISKYLLDAFPIAVGPLPAQLIVIWELMYRVDLKSSFIISPANRSFESQGMLRVIECEQVVTRLMRLNHHTKFASLVVIGCETAP
jgi:hypothetical protein